MQLRRQSGQILLIALTIMAVVAMIMAPLLAYINSSVGLTSESEDDLKAYYAAEAGVEAVLADLYKGHVPFDTSTNYPPAGSLLETDAEHSNKMAISFSEMHPMVSNAEG
jgi:Tfp pilus assembly protein PilX